jgi:succinyl-diaminopimelate desuccinylase
MATTARATGSTNAKDMKREVLKLSRELIRIPSITRNEHKIAEFIFGRLDQWGLRPRFIEVKDFGPSVLAEMGPTDAPSIVLNGHIDTVEVMSGWKHNPFGAATDKGMLYGLGSLDMKCGLAELMLAFKAISEIGLPGKSRVVLQAVSGEEVSSAGTRAMIAKGGFRKARVAIVGEGFGGTGCLTIGRRGGSYFDVDIKGKAAHGSTPEEGVNAIADAASIVEALGKMRMKRDPHLIAEDGQPLRETQTVLKISGGSDSFTVPEACRLKVVRCTIPGHDEGVGDQIREAIRSCKPRSRVETTLIKGAADLFEPYVTTPRSDLVRTASRWIKHFTGKEPRHVIGKSEADDNRISHDLGLPVVCYGPGEGGALARYHQPEEAVSVNQLGTAANVYVMTAIELMSRP